MEGDIKDKHEDVEISNGTIKQTTQVNSSADEPSSYLSDTELNRAAAVLQLDHKLVVRVVETLFSNDQLLAIVNCSSSLCWIANAPIANFVDTYYAHSGAANWLSLCFIMAGLPFAFLSMWSTRRFGLRTSLLLTGCGNGLGAVTRLLSAIVDSEYRFPIVLVGQIISACTYPFALFLPAKLAGAWFAPGQRAIANTLVTLANPIGIMLANLIAPKLVTNPDEVVLLNAFTAVPSILGCILSLIGIRSSHPPTPPSKSATHLNTPFIQGLKKCLSSRSFILLVMFLGGGLGMCNTLYTVMQQLLCAQGYSNSFSGVCSCVIIAGGVAGAVIAGIFVDRTKQIELAVKFSFALAVVCGIVFAQVSLHRGQHAAILTSAVLFGGFGVAAYPIGLEIGAECTFPVSETTSTGLIVLGGQLCACLFIAMVSALAKPLNGNALTYEVCTLDESGSGDSVEAKDMRVSMIAFNCVAAALAILQLLLFKPNLRRFKLENAKPTTHKNVPSDTNRGTEMKMIES